MPKQWDESSNEQDPAAVTFLVLVTGAVIE